MIKEEEIIEIGKFQKTHALKGELNALLDVGAEYLEDGNPLVIPVDGLFVPFYAESVRPKGTTSFLVKLKGVDDVEEATAFVNKPIYGLRKILAEYMEMEEGALLDDDLIGFRVEDVNAGYLGTVDRIDDSTINTLLVVDGDKGEIFIPLIDDFIESIDEGAETIIVDVPEDLIKLND